MLARGYVGVGERGIRKVGVMTMQMHNPTDWDCDQCGEENELYDLECWKCGFDREEFDPDA